MGVDDGFGWGWGGGRGEEIAGPGEGERRETVEGDDDPGREEERAEGGKEGVLGEGDGKVGGGGEGRKSCRWARDTQGITHGTILEQ